MAVLFTSFTLTRRLPSKCDARGRKASVVCIIRYQQSVGSSSIFE